MSHRTDERLVEIPIPRALGDTAAPSWSTEDTTALLLDLAAELRAAAEVLSGGVEPVPEFEAKLGMGFHLFVVTDLLTTIHGRLTEVGRPHSSHRAPAALAEFDGESDPEKLCWLAYDRFLGQAVELCGRILGAPGALADGPTRRIVRLHLPELLEAREWGLDVIARYLAVRTDDERSAFHDWTAAVPTGTVETTARRRRRTGKARRDARFSTFSHTRDYRENVPEALNADQEYAADLLELVRTNRDEIDAIETFGLVYFDLLPEAPMAMLHDLARTAWDESRHALLGQLLLAHMGLDPFQYPCSMIGIKVRSALGGWDALAQISLFGELNIITPMRSLASRAHSRGDVVVADSFDYICSDESLHLKRIRRWLKSHHPIRDIDAITRHTQQLAGRELERAGVLGHDYFVKLSGPEVFRLLGE